MNLRYEMDESARGIEFDGSTDEFAWLTENVPQFVQGLLEASLMVFCSPTEGEQEGTAV